LNQKGTPALYTDTLANRPAFGFQGRLFVSTDSGQIFEDTGTAWTLVADAGVGGGTLSSVCLNGNSTATGIIITAGGLSSNSITNTGITAGSILFAGTGGLQSQDNANFFWDDTNNRLGIGTASPGVSLDIHGTGTMLHLNGTSTNNSYLLFQNAGTGKWRIGNLYNAGANSFEIIDVLNATTRLTILNTGATTLNGTFTATSIIKSGGTASQYLMADGSVTTLTNPVTGTGTTNTLPKFTGASTIGNSNISDSGSLITLGSSTLITGSTTASSAIARGTYLTPTLVASANGDALIGLDINPTYTLGSFTSTTQYGMRINQRGSAQLILGSTSNAGDLFFARGSDGNPQGNVGYINGATASDFRIRSGGGSGTLGFELGTTRAAQFFTNGNLTLQNGGTFTDGGFRLDVQGTARITGALSGTSATFSASGQSLQLTSASDVYLNVTRGSSILNIGNDATSAFYVTNTSHRFYVNSGTINALTITATGSILINTTTDNGQGKLQVNGIVTAVNGSFSGELIATTSTSFNTTFYHIIASGIPAGQTYTLPTPASNNYQYVIVNKTAFPQTIAAFGGFTIYNLAGVDVASITLASTGKCYIIADGSGYYQIY